MDMQNRHVHMTTTTTTTTTTIKILTFQSIQFLCKIGLSFQHNFRHPMDLIPLGVQSINCFGRHSGSRLSTWIHVSLLFWIILFKSNISGSFLIWSFNVYPTTFLRNFIPAVSIFCLCFLVSVHVSEVYVKVGIPIVSQNLICASCPVFLSDILLIVQHIWLNLLSFISKFLFSKT
jgi:hypothetical protein